MALTNKLTAIADSIREKTGKTDLLTLDQMPVEIAAIETGGTELPDSAFEFGGSCNYMFYSSDWNWFIDMFGDKITTKDITAAKFMFGYNSSLERVPFVLNFKSSEKSHDLGSMFQDAYGLKEVPRMSGCIANNLSDMFNGCRNLREVPDWFVNQIDWSFTEAMTTYTAGGYVQNMFEDCYSLRKYPLELLKHPNPKGSYLYCYFYHMANNCYALDELVNIPLSGYNTSWSSNAFASCVTRASRLKNFTFALQEDGSPYVMKWKSQTIDLSNYVGYASDAANITGYNSGITADKRVTDDASYQALKNDPDWFTTSLDYSRYNHDSAVATINSLPDTSAYGTNTIKFKGAAGAKTDGGAINTLTPEEIAVATAKGWTVTLA